VNHSEFAALFDLESLCALIVAQHQLNSWANLLVNSDVLCELASEPESVISVGLGVGEYQGGIVAALREL
jgi:hypothetical protein